jgi:hypothetical protein
MSKVEQLEEQVKSLSPDELAEFRSWYEKFDWEAWDRQVADDDRAGRLDALADEALHEHARGKSTPL